MKIALFVIGLLITHAATAIFFYWRGVRDGQRLEQENFTQVR